MKQYDETPKIFVIFLIFIMVIMVLLSIFGSIKFMSSYFTKTDAEICAVSNSTLINGQCHSECNFPVNDRRNMMLFGGIVLIFASILIIIYGIVIINMEKKK